MNGTLLQVAGVATVLLMLLFVAIWVWVWHTGHKPKYDRLARMPMDDEEDRQ